MTRFRQALLDELRSRVDGAGPAPARRAARLTRPRLAFGGAALAVAAVTATVVAAQSGGTPAYAVTTEADGTVSVTVHRADDPADANRQLETADGRVVIMRMSDPADCPKADRGTLLPVGISDAVKRHKAIEEGAGPENLVRLRPSYIPLDAVLVLMVTPADGDGDPQLHVRWYAAPGPTCVVRSPFAP